MNNTYQYNSIFIDRLKLFKLKFQSNIQGFPDLDEAYMKEADNIISEIHSIYVRTAMLGRVSDNEVNQRLEAKKVNLFNTEKVVDIVKETESSKETVTEIEDESK